MFYKELQEKRKELGLTLEQVSQKIKINPDILDKIEKGEFSALPDLYIRLFIKSYALEMGFDPEEFLRKYEEEFGSKKHDVKQNIIKSEKPAKPEKPVATNFSDRNKLITFIATIAVLLFVIVILKQVLSEKEPPAVSPVHQRIMGRDTTIRETPQPKEESPVREEPVSAPVENEITTETALVDTTALIDLKMEINDTCWVKIVIDESDTSEAIFRPGTTRQWKASRVFDLRVGRPEVVKLFINDVEVDSIDTSKAPARMVITDAGIINR